MLPVASFALQPTQAVGAPFQGTGGVAKTHLHSQCCVRYSGYTLGATATSGTLQLPLAARSETSPGMGAPGHLASCRTFRKKGTPGPGSLWTQSKTYWLASSPSLPGPYPSGGPVCPEKKASTDGNWTQSVPSTLDGPFWTHRTGQGSFFFRDVNTYLKALISPLNQQGLNTYLVLYRKSLAASALSLEQLRPAQRELAQPGLSPGTKQSRAEAARQTRWVQR